jgi:hypothetical protein
MLAAMLFLATLCLLMSLLVLVPSLRVTVLQPAVDVLIAGVSHSLKVANL